MEGIDIDLSNVCLFKHLEDDLFVSYKFEFEYKTDKFEVDAKGRKIFIRELRHGVIKISKNCFSGCGVLKEGHHIEIVHDETDPIFFKLNQKQLEYLTYTCLSAINKFKTGSEFPDYAARQI